VVARCCGKLLADCQCLRTRGLGGAVLNVFCKTGQGGGIDPTCGAGKGGAGGMASSGNGPTTATPINEQTRDAVYERLSKNKFLANVPDSVKREIADDAGRATAKYGKAARYTNEDADAYVKNVFPYKNPISEEVSPQGERLQREINKHHLPNAETLYRGVSGDYAQSLLSAKPGDIIDTGGNFTSTSLSQHIPNVFGGDARMVIEAPKGTKAMFIEEKAVEMLLPARTKFRVKSVDGTMVHMEIVEQPTTNQLARAVHNIFCKTGQGGGVDPTCGVKAGGKRGSSLGDVPRRTYPGVLRQVQSVLEKPDPKRLPALARALGGLTSKELRTLKAEVGIRAGGTKAEQVGKLAAQIVRNVNAAERYARQARQLGHSREALRSVAGEFRTVHNDHADRINQLLKEVRARYEGASGKPLRRNNPAFDGGDHTKLKGWDSIARELAGNPKYTDLLHDAGYRGGGRGSEQKAYQTLFDLYKAGPVPRMSYAEGYERAIGVLRDTPPPPRNKQGARQGQGGQQDNEPFDLF
jgi:hypothetical protein